MIRTGSAGLFSLVFQEAFYEFSIGFLYSSAYNYYINTDIYPVYAEYYSAGNTRDKKTHWIRYSGKRQGRKQAMNDTVVITGGSRGIGRASAKAFADAGYRVAVIYKNSAEQAEKLAEELRSAGTDTEIYRCDVSSYNEAGTICEKILERFGRVDVLVNNAGISQIKLFTDITEQDWDEMFAVNMKGAFNFCSRLVPHMISRKSGNIINISSIWGVEGASCEVHYSASKAAVIGFTKALAKELGPSGINVNCIAPGFVDTDMNRELGDEAAKMFIDEIPLQRAGSPEDIADTIVFLASKGAKYITGQVINVNGGIL